MLLAIGCGGSLVLLSLELHLRGELSTHLLALLLESLSLFPLFVAPALDVTVDLLSPLSISHANNLTLHAHANLLIWVNHDVGARDLTL